MKQVHRPASLVRVVLLPRRKAPLAALFVQQGSSEDISHESVLPKNSNKPFCGLGASPYFETKRNIFPG